MCAGSARNHMNTTPNSQLVSAPRICSASKERDGNRSMQASKLSMAAKANAQASIYWHQPRYLRANREGSGQRALPRRGVSKAWTFHASGGVMTGSREKNQEVAMSKLPEAAHLHVGFDSGCV